MKDIFYTHYSSPVGKLLLVSDGKDLSGMYFQSSLYIPKIEPSWKKSPSKFSKAIIELNEYFAGKRKTFDLTLQLNGTGFQKSVWKSLNKIPYGKTVSYGDIAKSIGKPKAVRAVGTAVGQNPVCIITPCHRVIRSDGSIGGFAGGLKNKKILLQLESSR